MKRIQEVAFIPALGKILQSCEDFSTNLKLLNKSRINLINPRDEAYLKKYAFDYDIDIFTLKYVGTWTCFGIEHAHGRFPILRKNSRLLNLELAVKAVEANRSGKYFCTKTTEEYEESLEQAKKDECKEPFEREAIVLPSRDVFYVGLYQNSDLMKFLLGDMCEIYYRFCGDKDIPLTTVEKEIVDNQNGTLITPLWFAANRDKPGFVGHVYFIHHKMLARGVLRN